MKTAVQEAIEIIQLAREGEIDGDFRSIKYRIEQLLEKEKQQINQFKALWLVREGEYVLLKMELGKDNWVTLIREFVDSPFSHIIEPLGIEHKIKNITAPPVKSGDNL